MKYKKQSLLIILALFCTYFGVVSGPLAFGYFAQRMHSLSAAYLALAVVPVLAAGLLLWGGRARPTPATSSMGG